MTGEGISVPGGFLFGTSSAGLKKQGDDVAVAVSAAPANHAAIFTRNSFPAAPVTVSREIALAHEFVGGVVVNAGNANAATGSQGFEDARLMEETARVATGSANPYLVASTGVIGVPFPSASELVRAIRAAASGAAGGAAAFEAFARAIMTTDTVPKMASSAGDGYVVAGVTKGAGMIAPRMATTLTFVFTDARANNSLLRWALVRAYRATYERISVDADTSTNDCIVVLANGASGTALSGRDAPRFTLELENVLRSLATQLLRDAEGATKLVTVVASGFPRDDWARTVARAIGDSLLVKTAVHGADANWGRVLAAAGKTELPLDASRVRIFFGPYLMFAGEPQPFSEDDVRAYLEGPEITIAFDAGNGTHAYEYMTCDLSGEYVAINASYRS